MSEIRTREDAKTLSAKRADADAKSTERMRNACAWMDLKVSSSGWVLQALQEGVGLAITFNYPLILKDRYTTYCHRVPQVRPAPRYDRVSPCEFVAAPIHDPLSFPGCPLSPLPRP